MPRSTRRPVLPALAVAALALGACGSDDEDKESAAAKPAAFAVEATEQGKRSVLKAPKSVKAGLVEVTLTSAGKKEHEAQIIKLEQGHSAQEAIKAIAQSEKKGIPTWIRGGGGVAPTKPGASEKVTMVLEPGSYAVTDTDENRAAPVEFEVTGEKADATLPKTPAKIDMKDYSFAPSGLKAGKNRVLVVNSGKELHHVIAARMAPGATIGDVGKFFRTEKGKPPIEEEGGAETTVLDGGKSMVAELDLKAGKYALLCFINDRKGGPPHIAKGMIAEAEVK